jgi:hypothetical protein
LNSKPMFDFDASGYQRRDVLESEEGYNPLWRTAGIAAVGGATFVAHKYALNSNPDYAETMFRWASKFEEVTPNRMGSTFRFSERASSYVVDDLHFTRRDLFHEGKFTDQGAHFQRIFGDAFDLQGHLDSAAGAEGIRFKRKQRGSAFLDLEGVDGVRVRFTKAGGHYAGASRRYKAPLKDHPVDWSWNTSDPVGTTWGNFNKWRESQHTTNWSRGAKSSNGSRYAPWYAQQDAEEGASAWSQSRTAYSNFHDAVAPQLFELFERPQKLFAEFGFGLKNGGYNKVFHVPGIGSGGFLNRFLTRRVLPAAVALTAARWVDYKLDHKPSNTVLDTALKANVLRADLTDVTPGARSMTDWYAENVPGPQYGPLALPLTGAFIGGLAHLSQVAFTDKFAGNDRVSRAFRDAEGSTLPKFDLLKRAFKAEGGVAGKGAALWKSLGTPGKGAVIGLAAMIPFIPGMLGSRKTGSELRRIYSGEDDVAVRQGRWWEVGSNAFSGSRITSWRKHASVLYKSHAAQKSLYGSEENYWSHNPFLHPFKFLHDPYWLEKEHYKDRPYPVTSPAFTNVPLVGPLLAATIGKIIKPVKRMHKGEWDEHDYTLYSSRLEPKGKDALPTAKPKEEFGLWQSVKQEKKIFEEFIGLIGFTAKSLGNALFPDQNKGKDVYLQGSRQMDSWSRQYYERNLGAGMMVSPETENGLVGWSEPLRRLIQHEGFSPQINEIANEMPSWIPGEDHLINFRKGDPFVKVDEGYARLPGAGYAALHPDVEGLDPEDYPDINKLGILGDIAPYSREFNRIRSVLDKSTRDDPEMRSRYEQIVDQVRQTKESTLQVDQRRFDAPVDRFEGTVKSASFRGVELKEYPGRIFNFSSVGSSMADLVAETLGKSNATTRAQAARDADGKLKERDTYLSAVMAEGTRVNLTVGRGAVENSLHARAVFEVDGININRDLIDRGFGRFRKDLGGAEEQDMHGGVAQILGKYAEAISFEGDNSRWNPLRYLPGQVQTKLWQERTAYSQYLQQEAIGTRMRRWERPIHDFLSPYLRGVVERAADVAIIPEDVQRNRDLDTLTDELGYLRALKGAADSPERRGLYTSQERRTAVGSNLFGSAGYVASTLPSREARYFKKFVDETDPEVRERIMSIVPGETGRALEAQWAKSKAQIREASGEGSGEVGSQGRFSSKEDIAAYEQSDSKLGMGDWLRSVEISKFFSRTGFSLPDAEDSEALDKVLDYQDVKLKIVQQEGYDEHDFNLFDDRSSLLWRKPYIEGAVQELTSGDGRSQDELRVAVETMMLAAGKGNANADVRTTARPSQNEHASIRVDAEIQNEDPALEDIRRNPDAYHDE